MITGFVMYRSGYFESSTANNSLQTSPNGGELLLASAEQDTNRSPQINQTNQPPIMPSSKSFVPIMDIEEIRPEIMPSSKSMTHPIKIEPTQNQVSEKARQVYKVQPELNPNDSSAITIDSSAEPVAESHQDSIEAGDEPELEGEKPNGISWGLISLGVLGILFVGIGSIVYFKRKST